MDRTLTGFYPSRSIDQTRGADGAASTSDEILAQARGLVRHLPWRAKGHNLSRPNADTLTRAIATAMTDYELTLADAQNHALTKLSEVQKPARAADYVIDGFEAKNLPEPVAADVDTLPLPGTASAKNDQRTSDSAVALSQGKSGLQATSAPRHLPACGMCGAEDGEQLAVRTVHNPSTGRASKCPDCHPYAKTA